MTNQEKLRRLMKRHNLSTKQVAALLGASKVTVASWLRPESNKARRNIPSAKLRLLELLLVTYRNDALKRSACLTGGCR